MHLQGLVERFVSDDIHLQISSLYATQVFCYDKQFPKGRFGFIMESVVSVSRVGVDAP